MPTGSELDIVVHGATGFAGRLVAAHLATAAPVGTRIGLSGRNGQRLAAVREQLGAVAADWPLLITGAEDEPALARLAARTRVVLSTVGPYAKHGLPLLLACARAGTDYADLTGELAFVRAGIDAAHELARRSGARIVPACGFDSIPSDLGTLLLHQAALADGAGLGEAGGTLGDTTYVLVSAAGGFSGGTLTSMVGVFDQARSDPAVAALVRDPYALFPDRSAEPRLGPEPDDIGVVYNRDLGGWLGPFIMAGFNTRVVRRTNALSGFAYGRRFRYRELQGYGSGFAGGLLAHGVTGAVGVGIAALGFGPTRGLLERLLPEPGTGPGEQTRNNGHFQVRLVTTTTSGARYAATVAASGDPGYAATSTMLGQTGLALASDRDRLPDAAGVLTPATGLGHTLIDRLRAAGMRLSVQRLPSGSSV